jgi:hypothetical protein
MSYYYANIKNKISIHFVENRSIVNRTNSITDYANNKRKFN